MLQTPVKNTKKAKTKKDQEEIVRVGGLLDLFDDNGNPLYDTIDSDNSNFEMWDYWSWKDCFAYSYSVALDGWGEARITYKLSWNWNIYEAKLSYIKPQLANLKTSSMNITNWHTSIITFPICPNKERKDHSWELLDIYLNVN